MCSYRPDWWDIGKRYGPRSYMTILAIKALRSFIYLSTVLEKKLDQLKTYEVLASQMQSSLNTKLWADDVNYLMNYYEDGKRDEHLYMGSLSATHYSLLNKEHADSMIHTARLNLIAKHVGVYKAFPMDYHTLQTFWNFNGNEAGATYYYMNGGIWSHANAWYRIMGDQRIFELFISYLSTNFQNFDLNIITERVKNQFIIFQKQFKIFNISRANFGDGCIYLFKIFFFINSFHKSIFSPIY
jgi:hypothetical protein